MPKFAVGASGKVATNSRFLQQVNALLPQVTPAMDGLLREFVFLVE